MPTPTSKPALNSAVGADGRSRTIPEPIARRVWVAAGGRCTICNRWLLGDDFTGESVFIGQLAHIVGWATTEGSPRGSEPLAVEDRNAADNLMLLCYDQHRVIDNKSLWEHYSPERLTRMKREHERRIKQVTGLTAADQTLVLRVVSNIHGAPVQLSKSAVSNALLASGRFPSYVLDGVDEYEIDLRAIPGEESSESMYWLQALTFIRDRLAKLDALVAQGQVVDISVFALARIPVLITLGHLLDDTVPTTIYPKLRTGGEAWGWPAKGTAREFDWSVLHDTEGTTRQVTVVFSISGSIDPGKLPPAVTDGARVYEIRPVRSTPNFDLVDTDTTVDFFGSCWRELLGEIEKLGQMDALNIVPAVPTTIAVAIGRSLNKTVHPPARVFDLVDRNSDYALTLELPQ